MNRALLVLSGLLALALAGTSASGGPADVLAAEVRCAANDRCDVHVTVEHVDEGWQHYADRWDVLGPDREVLAERVLRHPHVNEQPFTRALRGIVIPESIREVTIRAHDSVHGLGGAELTVEVERSHDA